MKITRISSIRKHRIFQQFRWPNGLADFSQKNLIYGWNGSGKSTLAGIFRAMEKRDAIHEGDIEIAVDGTRVDAKDFPSSVHLPPVRVFDRTFIDTNIFTSSLSVSPILVLGKENVDKQKNIDQLRLRLDELTPRLREIKTQKSAAERQLDQFCVSQANTVIKPRLRSAGDNPYSNYDKARFKNKCEVLSKWSQETKSANTLTDAEIATLEGKVNSSPKSPRDKLQFATPDLHSFAARGEAICQSTVQSNLLKNLQEDFTLSGWVQEGLRLHHEHGSSECLFCAQPLPADRVRTLDAHFNDQYRAFQQSLQALVDELQGELRRMTETIALPEVEMIYEDLRADYESAVAAFHDYRLSTADYIRGLLGILESKRECPFQPLGFQHPLPNSNADVVNRINNVFDRHNDITSQFEGDIVQSRERLEVAYVLAALPRYLELRKAAANLADEEQRLMEEIDCADRRIAELEAEIIEHATPARELNDDLHSYLGTREICFEIEKTGYRISRDGVPADHLSEGEKTAIAFLYFLKSLKDRNFSLQAGVVVIDDPVSSLDSNSLFHAFGFLKERTKDAGQLFVLTHNHSFFRLVKNWFSHVNSGSVRGGGPKLASFYMLKTRSDNGCRNSNLEKLDGLLKDFDSDYHYLFKVVYGASRETDSRPLEAYYYLPNAARRLLEAFFTFRIPYSTGDLYARLERVDFDTTKKTLILRFLNVYSHGSLIDGEEIDQSILSESATVLRYTLELMKQEDPRHFDGMLKAIGRSGAFP